VPAERSGADGGSGLDREVAEVELAVPALNEVHQAVLGRLERGFGEPGDHPPLILGQLRGR